MLSTVNLQLHILTMQIYMHTHMHAHARTHIRTASYKQMQMHMYAVCLYACLPVQAMKTNRDEMVIRQSSD